MGKKVRKKTQASTKEKGVATHSPKKVAKSCNPTAESIDKGVAVAKETNSCPHLVKGINLSRLSSKIGSSRSIRCEDCREGAADRRGSKGKGKHGKKKGGASLDSKSESKAIWVCLECGQYTCGGVGLPTTPHCHVVRHVRQNRHPLVVHCENPQLCWCFSCNMLIQADKIEENEETSRLLSDVVKLLKGQSSEKSSVDIEDLGFGDGGVTSEIKSGTLFRSDSHGQGGYVVRGMINLGNTCFFNSIMQNLLAMSRLRDSFLNLDAPIGPLISSLKKLFTETNPESGLKNIINPRSFFGCVCSKSPQFRGYQQHDSHELLRCLLDGLSTEELAARKQNGSPMKDGTSSNTLVDDLFGGQISSTVCCTECGYFSTVYEPFLDLSLPVPTKRPPPWKAQQVTRTKKAKLPPKKGGKTRVKVNGNEDPLAVQSLSNKVSIHESTSPAQPNISVAGEMVALSGDSTVLGSEEISNVADKEDLSSPNLVAVGESQHMQVLDNDANKISASSDDLVWLDYVEAGTVTEECDFLSQKEDAPEVNDTGRKDECLNELPVQDSYESNGPVCYLKEDQNLRPDSSSTSGWEDEVLSSPNLVTVGESQHMQVLDNDANKISASSDDLVRLDYVEAGTVTDGCDFLSQKEDAPEVYDTGRKDECLNELPVQDSCESNGPVCYLKEDQNLRPDSSASGWEDEVPLQVQGSEVLLLPYKEESSSAGEIIGRDGQASSSNLGGGQEELEFDGLGDLFNEPEVVAGPAPRPSSSSEVTEASFVVRNNSESEPDEVDDTDSPVSVESCLAHFIKPELLSDENAWNCENCSKIVRHQKIEAKMKTKSVLDGIKTGCHDEPLDEANSCSVKVRSVGNGDITNDKNVESSISHAQHGTELENGQTNDLSSIVNEKDHGTFKMKDTHDEEFQASGSDKACNEESCNHSAADSCVTSHKTENVERRDPQMLCHDNNDSEECSVEEADSKSLKLKRDATKRVLIYKAPPVLTIHLKRFSQDARGRFSKLNGHVNFRETMDLRPYMDPRCLVEEKYQYHLVGVVEHLGTMRGGHYVAYVRGGQGNKGKADKENESSTWYHASDAYVREVSLDEVLRCEAYILFYEKI